MNVAIIDIGSNTVLLLIASIVGRNQVKTLVEKAEITRLSAKLDDDQNLQEASMQATLKVLRQYTDLCHRNQVSKIFCIGTEALRRAQNSHHFIREVESLCGFRVEIISGKQEAQYAYLSAAYDFDEVYPSIVVIDVGGGSTEVVWELESEGDRARLQMVSMKMGSVRLHEKFIQNDPITSSELKALTTEIERKLDHDLMTLPLPPQPFTLIGLAGTATTLASIDQRLMFYDSEKVQDSKLGLKGLQQIIHDLKSKNLEDRKCMVGMEPKRADVLLPGALILECVMRKLKTDRLIVSDHGIRYGLLYQKMMSGEVG